ncbi:DUF3015 domain-containing protein [Leptospira levettii]|uniref:DUF3015 domain-containing protein n=1 Tax=Leptospira levettii TaxID=2023178 RepID=A0A6H3NBM7_9LEPT|nr:DUF3015 domain-containing protein [Leptospira levettii]MCW7465489.1 DUF3015 domain-containing protein [Leptospira levettii]MCW7474318.1 DUF3015 domain-containing protein [Leptospira levettii]MCW7496327.1 DUF3015 domain-containing protein [Leptospira levettii]MCW7507298.1 DUF3015 domain-containing protein [Leptospira levettii]MCW7510228.1 DUF3015 domain-containing protein [Leptospira levettii]
MHHFRGRTILFFHITFISLLLLSNNQPIQAESYGMAGCGLGSMVPVWKNDIGQVLAATTNVSFSSQTFGITSGTSNCTTDGIVKQEMAQEVFIAYNESALELETTKGNGERIRAMATLLGCPTHANELGKLMKENHSYLFGKTDLDNQYRSKEILTRLKTQIASHSNLKSVCMH